MNEQLLFSPTPPAIEWDYPDNVIAIISITGGYDYATITLGTATGAVRYTPDGPVQTTIKTGLTSIRDPRLIPDKKLYITSNTPTALHSVFGISGCASLTKVLWSPNLRASRIYAYTNPQLVEVSKYLPKEITSLYDAFRQCPQFNSDITNWDTSTVTNMVTTFQGCANFNQDISSWDVSKVTSMSGVFLGCSSFNQDLSGWDVSNAVSYNSFDSGATAWLPEYKPKFK